MPILFLAFAVIFVVTVLYLTSDSHLSTNQSNGEVVGGSYWGAYSQGTKNVGGVLLLKPVNKVEDEYQIRGTPSL
jgi:hypothetical protein